MDGHRRPGELSLVGGASDNVDGVQRESPLLSPAEEPLGMLPVNLHSASVSLTDTVPSRSNGSSMPTSWNRPARFSRSKQQARRNAVIRPASSLSRAGSSAYRVIRARAESK